MDAALEGSHLTRPNNHPTGKPVAHTHAKYCHKKGLTQSLQQIIMLEPVYIAPNQYNVVKKYEYEFLSIARRDANTKRQTVIF